MLRTESLGAYLSQRKGTYLSEYWYSEIRWEGVNQVRQGSLLFLSRICRRRNGDVLLHAHCLPVIIHVLHTSTTVDSSLCRPVRPTLSSACYCVLSPISHLFAQLESSPLPGLYRILPIAFRPSPPIASASLRVRTATRDIRSRTIAATASRVPRLYTKTLGVSASCKADIASAAAVTGVPFLVFDHSLSLSTTATTAHSSPCGVRPSSVLQAEHCRLPVLPGRYPRVRL